jgi:hypothetical protein
LPAFSLCAGNRPRRRLGKRQNSFHLLKSRGSQTDLAGERRFYETAKIPHILAAFIAPSGIVSHPLHLQLTTDH